MSKDPFFDVKYELESTLSSLPSLLSTYTRLLSQSSSSSKPPSPSQSRELNSARDELRGTLGALDADIEDLEESVRVVESVGGMYGLDEEEIRSRRKFVREVKGRVEAIRRSIQTGNPSTGPSSSRRPPPSHAYRDEESSLGEPNDVESWEREEQMALMDNQDQTLSLISGTLSTLHGQASLMGREVGDQNVMLEDLSGHVDSTEGRLNKAMKKMGDFMRKSEEKGSGWCILLLIVLLIILLMAVILI
ncbi:t-SNARE [Mrakia frigida]|uniref:Tlg1p n=1 Tax=Mrakia frigida TaxID=29902 RepID=UPI003FCC07FF